MHSIREFQSSPALSGRCNILHYVGMPLYLDVSILTGPFGPVQPKIAVIMLSPQSVSILTGPFGPVQRYGSEDSLRARGRFNPHRPFRAGATREDIMRPAAVAFVSILTGPFGPVQLGGNHVGNLQSVSILTGPFGPVQHERTHAGH